MGNFVAGDEKLFHFTGNSGHIRLVVPKSDRIGLWFYELCAPLMGSLSFLLYFRMHVCNTLLGQELKTIEIIQEWANIIKSKGKHEEYKPSTMLCMDFYYLTQEAKENIEVPFVAAESLPRFS